MRHTPLGVITLLAALLRAWQIRRNRWTHMPEDNAALVPSAGSHRTQTST